LNFPHTKITGKFPGYFTFHVYFLPQEISTFLLHFQIQYRAKFPVSFLHPGQVTFLYTFSLHRIDEISCTFPAHRKCGVKYKYPIYEMHWIGEISCTFPVYRIDGGLFHLT